MSLPTPVVAGLVLALVWFFAVPVLVLVHELGHAAATLAFTDGTATVVVGGERRRWERGRLTVRFDPGGWRRWWYGFTRYGRLPAAAWREAVVHLAGPAATAVVLLVVTVLVNVASGRWIRFALYSAFWWTAFQLAGTLVPLRYPSWWGSYADHPSDGLQAQRALAGE